MKETELKLIRELMKNSRRSDRELAKAIGISQPTVTRLRSKLEKEGYIKEYTMIPNLNKLGYEILAITFVKLHRQLKPEEIENARKIAKKSLAKNIFPITMLERGEGLGYDGVFCSYHEDYTSYVEFIEWLRRFDFLQIDKIESFLVNLRDKIRYRPLTFSELAENILIQKEKTIL
jgi:DNA-binding Lrp family transcriptional regulator